LHNVLRPDVVRSCLTPDQVLANAPDREDDFV
jgi:Asp-tRNA(Asn)/Glu-tRNA(Gln) amidotransferase C subunit